MKKFIFTILFIFLVIAIQGQVSRTNVLQDLEKNQPANQDQTITATLTSSSRLFGDKDDLTSVILIIPVGSTVTVLGSDSTYFHVIYDQDEGYIFKRHAVIDEKPVNITPANQTGQVQQQERPAEQQQQISRFTYLENKYGTNMAARLNAGKIWKGMTADMVIDSWGKPAKINRIIGNNTLKEEWIYRNTWLYIENNNLVDWGPVRQ
jgi:hypothetical protein